MRFIEGEATCNTRMYRVIIISEHLLVKFNFLKISTQPILISILFYYSEHTKQSGTICYQVFQSSPHSKPTSVSQFWRFAISQGVTSDSWLFWSYFTIHIYVLLNINTTRRHGNILRFTLATSCMRTTVSKWVIFLCRTGWTKR